MGVGEGGAREGRCQEQSRTEEGYTEAHTLILPLVEYRPKRCHLLVDAVVRVSRE